MQIPSRTPLWLKCFDLSLGYCEQRQKSQEMNYLDCCDAKYSSNGTATRKTNNCLVSSLLCVDFWSKRAWGYCNLRIRHGILLT